MGKKLLVEAKDVTKTKNIPVCGLNDGMKEVVHAINQGGAGIAIILAAGKIVGVISDGDIRKSMDNEQQFLVGGKDIMND